MPAATIAHLVSLRVFSHGPIAAASEASSRLTRNILAWHWPPVMALALGTVATNSAFQRASIGPMASASPEAMVPVKMLKPSSASFSPCWRASSGFASVSRKRTSTLRPSTPPLAFASSTANSTTRFTSSASCEYGPVKAVGMPIFSGSLSCAAAPLTPASTMPAVPISKDLLFIFIARFLPSLKNERSFNLSVGTLSSNASGNAALSAGRMLESPDQVWNGGGAATTGP